MTTKTAERRVIHKTKKKREEGVREGSSLRLHITKTNTKKAIRYQIKMRDGRKGNKKNTVTDVEKAVGKKQRGAIRKQEN